MKAARPLLIRLAYQPMCRTTGTHGRDAPCHEMRASAHYGGNIAVMLLARAKHLLRDVMGLVYPTSCAFCMVHADGAGPLCNACMESLTRQEQAAACPACAMPLAMLGDPCPYCEGKGEPNLERVVRLAVYADPVRHLIYRMKYHGRWYYRFRFPCCFSC
jgi:hypothetical protein